MDLSQIRKNPKLFVFLQYSKLMPQCCLSTIRQARATVLSFTFVDIAGSSVQLTDDVKIRGDTLDSQLTFNNHVQNVCESANYQIKALRHIRSLTTDMAKTVACVLVNTRLDYANSVQTRTLKSCSECKTRLPES